MSQIRQAENTRRALGGLGAAMLLVRTNRPFQKVERELAGAYRLKVIDAADAWKFFDRLAEFAGFDKLPASLQRAQAALDRRYSLGMSQPFSRSDCRSVVVLDTPIQSGDLQRRLNRVKKERGQDWSGWLSEGRLEMVLPVGDVNSTRASLESLVKPYGARVDGAKETNSGKQVRVILDLNGANQAELIQKLDQHRSTNSLLQLT